MIAVEYLSDLRKASADRALAALLEDAAAVGYGWDEQGAPGSSPLTYVRARCGEECAILPLRLHDGTALGAAGASRFPWRPLVTPGASTPALFEAAARDLRRRAWRVSLPDLPEEDGTASALTAAFRRAGWSTRCQSHESNPIVRVAGRSFAAYRATLPEPLRCALRRPAPDISCTIHTAIDDDIWGAYQSLCGRSELAQSAVAALPREWIEAEARAGRLRLGLARQAAQPVAAALWTVDAASAYVHTPGDPAEGGDAPADLMLTAGLFAHAIDCDRVELIDFGRGMASHLQAWVEDVRPRYHLTALNLRRPRAWWRLASEISRRISAQLAPDAQPR